MLRKLSSSIVRPAVTAACQQRLFAAAAASPSDPIQKLFVDKLHEYTSKSAKSADGLVDADAQVKAQLADEMMRVKRNFNVKEGEETKITSKFNEADFQPDSIHMKDWK